MKKILFAFIACVLPLGFIANASTNNRNEIDSVKAVVGPMAELFNKQAISPEQFKEAFKLMENTQVVDNALVCKLKETEAVKLGIKKETYRKYISDIEAVNKYAKEHPEASYGGKTLAEDFQQLVDILRGRVSQM